MPSLHEMSGITECTEPDDGSREATGDDVLDWPPVETAFVKASSGHAAKRIVHFSRDMSGDAFTPHVPHPGSAELSDGSTVPGSDSSPISNHPHTQHHLTTGSPSHSFCVPESIGAEEEASFYRDLDQAGKNRGVDDEFDLSYDNTLRSFTTSASHDNSSILTISPDMHWDDHHGSRASESSLSHADSSNRSPTNLSSSHDTPQITMGHGRMLSTGSWVVTEAVVDPQDGNSPGWKDGRKGMIRMQALRATKDLVKRLRSVSQLALHHPPSPTTGQPESSDLPYVLPPTIPNLASLSLDTTAPQVQQHCPSSSSPERIVRDVSSSTRVIGITHDLRVAVTIEIKQTVVYQQRVGGQWLPLV